MNKNTERKILKIYNLVYNDVFNKKTVSKLATNQKMYVYEVVRKLETSSAYDKFATRFSEELAKAGLSKNKTVWRKFYKVAKERHVVALPTTWKEFEMKAYSEAVKENFKMIKSIPSKMLEIMNHDYTSKLIEEVAKGALPRGSFQRELAKHGVKNAKLIARTESAKLQTTITEVRAKSIGSKAYIWLSSNDKRTRPSHKEMNGVVVLWKSGIDKPLLDGMYGNAGEFPNCRCDAQPIVDEDDLDEEYYKFYDYQQHRIMKMSRKRLLEILDKGDI